MRMVSAMAMGACALGMASARHVEAQKPAPIELNLHVVDSTGAAVGAANVSVVSGLSTVIASAVMDSAGRGTIRFTVTPGDYQIVTRKVGYARTDRFFHIPVGGMVSLD